MENWLISLPNIVVDTSGEIIIRVPISECECATNFSSFETDTDNPPNKRQRLDTITNSKLQMHSVDVEPEPAEVLLELGLLITEGRKPTSKSPKGFEEGPHW